MGITRAIIIYYTHPVLSYIALSYHLDSYGTECYLVSNIVLSVLNRCPLWLCAMHFQYKFPQDNMYNICTGDDIDKDKTYLSKPSYLLGPDWCYSHSTAFMMVKDVQYIHYRNRILIGNDGL